MTLGLKRGTVSLLPHDPGWTRAAAEAIALLGDLLGPDALDIQHVGSTAIPGIPAKPILDLAVAVRNLEDVRRHDDALLTAGFLFRGSDQPGQLLYVCGDADSRTHHIHVMTIDHPAWQNYLNFRDYLTACPEEAARYARRKEELAAAFPEDRNAYTNGKRALVQELLEKAARWRAQA